MHLIMRFCVVFMTGLVLSVGAALNAESPNLASFNRSVKIEIPVKNAFKIGTYVVEANLESLPAKSEGEIVVKLRNTEAFDLPIKDVTATCGCTRARLMSTLIPANGEAELNIKLRTPDRGPSATAIAPNFDQLFARGLPESRVGAKDA